MSTELIVAIVGVAMAAIALASKAFDLLKDKSAQPPSRVEHMLELHIQRDEHHIEQQGAAVDRIAAAMSQLSVAFSAQTEILRSIQSNINKKAS